MAESNGQVQSRAPSTIHNESPGHSRTTSVVENSRSQTPQRSRRESNRSQISISNFNQDDVSVNAPEVIRLALLKLIYNIMFYRIYSVKRENYCHMKTLEYEQNI